MTRVSISPKEGGPNEIPSIHAQSGIYKNHKFSGSGSDSDIITLSARAYISAVNKLLSWNARRIRQIEEEEIEANAELGDTETADLMPVNVVQP